jgi:tetraacyldisaccharide 4'-kinase
MKAPRFWYRKPGWQSALLAPLAWVYARLGDEQAVHRLHRRYTAKVPVVSVGNLTAGGSGKTPLVAHLARHFSKTHKVAIVSRGYGGTVRIPLKVEPDLHAAAQVGDEPLMLARRLQGAAAVYIARHRPHGVRLAEKEGATLLLLDDGFQRRDIARTVDIVAVDGARGFGNGKVIPAGPLREPATALRRAHIAVVSNGKDKTGLLEKGPTFHLALSSDPATLGKLKGKRVLAFAGLANPDKFFAALKNAGLKLAATQSFPDHHAYTAADRDALAAAAKRKKALLACTEKDAVKLPPGFAHVVRERLSGPDLAKLVAEIEKRLTKRRAR